MRRPSLIFIVFCSLLACGLGYAQKTSSANSPGDSFDPNDTAGRFDNLRAINQFGSSLTTFTTIRDTVFAPMAYDAVVYAKVPKKARSDFEKGNEALKKREYEKAKEQYQSAIAEYPEFALAHHNLAVADLSLKDAHGARNEFTAATKVDPQMASAYQNLGVLEIQQQNLDAALEPLQSANRLKPTDLKTLTLLAYCQALTHQQEQAVLTAQHVHSFKDHKAYAYVHMIAGTALESMGKRDEAIHEYKQFLSEDPTDPRASAARQQLQGLQAKP